MFYVCENCLVKELCCEMCDKVKPFFESLVIKDEEFDYETYLNLSERAHDIVSSIKYNEQEGIIDKESKQRALNELKTIMSQIEELRNKKSKPKTEKKKNTKKITDVITSELEKFKEFQKKFVKKLIRN